MKSKTKDNLIKNIVIAIWIILFILSTCGIMVEAAAKDKIEAYPTDSNNQYIELKATTIEDKGGRQTINNGTLGPRYKL